MNRTNAQCLAHSRCSVNACWLNEGGLEKENLQRAGSDGGEGSGWPRRNGRPCFVDGSCSLQVALGRGEELGVVLKLFGGCWGCDPVTATCPAVGR